MPNDERQIKAVKDAVTSGYAHAFVVTRPWVAIVEGKKLMNRRGGVRRFTTEAAAIAAARRMP